MSARQTFLKRVREAVVEGNRAGATPVLPDRRGLGYQGAGPEPMARFCEELQNAGGYPHVAQDRETAWQIVRDVIRAKAARNIVMGQGGMIARLDLEGRLKQEALDVTTVGSLRSPGSKDVFFGADLGISNVAYLVAETGSVVMATEPDEPRSLSLLPPVHIAIAHLNQMVPDLFDLFDLFSPISAPGNPPPSCLTLITGPSKTGDIELRLVTGVHGPGEIHVVLCLW